MSPSDPIPTARADIRNANSLNKNGLANMPARCAVADPDGRLAHLRSRISRDACPAIREVLNRVGDKWSSLIVVMLSEGRMRFSDLRRAIVGISQRMLTRNLRALERDGLVRRTVLPTVPPRVDYELTPLGQTLVEPILLLAAWASENREAIATARGRFDGEAVAQANGNDPIGAPRP